MTCEYYECDGLIDIEKNFQMSLLEAIKNKYCNKGGVDCPYASHLKHLRDIEEGKIKMFSKR